MYSYDEVYSATLEYFNGDDLAANVFCTKYVLKTNEGEYLEKTPDDMHRRMAREFARIEAKKFKRPFKEDEIYDMFRNFRYIVPQGSPMYGIGNDHQIISLSNCFFLDVPMDCYNHIMDVDKQLVNVSKRRGGVGIDLSGLRPVGALTKNAAHSSTGIPSWMNRYSNSIREVGQNNRRGALMLTLSVHHPDIMYFATIKNDKTKVTGANISVRLTKEFMDAVENDTEYELRFPVDGADRGKYSKMVRAREVWDTIINSAWLRAEPGLLMWDNVLTGPADCYPRFRSKGTNPCSEITLSELDSCRLMLLNLLSFVKNPFTPKAYFDYEEFAAYAYYTQRLMDDMVDLESEKIDSILKKIKSDPEPGYVKRQEYETWERIKKNNDEGRRTGTGITALGDTLAAIGIKYGSEESIKAVDDIYRTLKLSCYRASVDMAKELGPFVGWNPELEKDCEFLNRIKEEDPKLFSDMKKYGRRNIALLTTAPAGSVSLETQTTSGFECLFVCEEYTRRRKLTENNKTDRCDYVDKNGDRWQNYTVWHKPIQKWMEITGETDVTKSPWYGACANDIDWISRVKMQATAQKHVCHSISSTINLPSNATRETIAEIYMAAFKSGCKGITVYRDGCRDGVLVSKTQERPKELPCDVHHVTVRGLKYTVLVGLQNDVPYETFACRNGTLDSAVKTGIIVRKKKGFYKAVFENGDELAPITALMSEEEEIISRLTSGLLRTGAEMHFIVKQLERVGENKDINCFARSIARALKKYIKDGTKEGEVCPDCGADLVRSSGCKSCSVCAFTVCM